MCKSILLVFQVEDESKASIIKGGLLQKRALLQSLEEEAENGTR